MRVLEFGVGHPESEHHLSDSRASVRPRARTTTTPLWVAGTLDEESAGAARRPGSDGREFAWVLIAAAHRTRAESDQPVQDVPELGARVG
jgi:hypothetical protein